MTERQANGATTLTTVYENDDFQLTGVSVSRTGRLFVNFPRWSDRYLHAVCEIAPDGAAKPYPDDAWNAWNLKPATAGTAFVCVQSVVVDTDDVLWVVDAAAPLLASVVPGGAKLVAIDLATDRVVRVIAFDPDVAKADSYLNDIRIDTRRNTAYLTDSGHGGLIVVDLATGSARRVLDGHPSVFVEPGVSVVVRGKELLQHGKPPQFDADGIALSPGGAYVYYKPVTGKTLYRIATETLRDSGATPDAVGRAVEIVAQTFPTDGLWMDAAGTLYLTDVENDAVARLLPSGALERVVSSPALRWPDTFSQGPDGRIYVSASHIDESPNFNGGKSVRSSPYAVFAFAP